MSRFEHDDIVRVWTRRYVPEKEREFIKRIDRFIPSDRVTLLDIGCGIGLHTLLWSERNKQVTGSDLSTQFRDHFVRTYRFPFIQNDVLNCTIQEQYDICFCMAIGTILHGEEERFRTFETLRTLVRDGGFLVLIACSNQRPFRTRSNGELLHCIDDRDSGKLRDLGFALRKTFYWSSSPLFLWRSPAWRWLGRMIEAIGFRLGIGARKVVVCQLKTAVRKVEATSPGHPDRPEPVRDHRVRQMSLAIGQRETHGNAPCPTASSG